jgi:penicillin-binding protein 1B
MASKKKRRERVKAFIWRHSIPIALTVMVIFTVTIGFLGYTYAIVTRKFDSSRLWDLPSRIYSDATPIVPGLTYKRELLEPKLNHLGYYEVKAAVRAPGQYRYVGDDLEIYLQNFRYPDMEFRGFPVRVETDEGEVKRIRRVEDSVTLRGVRLEPELITSIYNDVMEDRLPVPLAVVPKHLVDAIISTEDRAFWKHEGISARGIARALITDIKTGQLSAGGSTLTQQLVKNLYLNPERTFRRKAHEAVMALMLEARYSKESILEAYLNEIYLGQNGAVQIVGVEQASQIYFGRHVSNLSLGDAATLAGIVKSPNVFSPLRNPEKAKERRNLVLGVMLEQKKITREEYDKALAAPMTVNKFPRSFNSAPFFVDLVLKQLRETYPQTQLTSEGLRIFTTLDTIMQRSAEKSLVDGIANLNKKYAHLRKIQSPLQGVVLTIQPGTGYVKALVGGRSYQKSQFNRAFQARRQPGSLFKPFVYVTAMDPARGSEAWTTATLLEDSPISIGNWRPQNYDGKFHGTVTIRRALAFSYNIPAVRAAINAGVPNVIQLASRTGIESPLQPYPSISLGSFEVSPLEIAYAYSVFANDGVKAEPISILAVSTREGRILESREVRMRRVAPASVSYVMNDMLKDVLEYGTAGSVRSHGFRRPFAGKTGTTNDYRDAWFVAYSPRILTLVWVGFDDRHNVGLAGSEAAIPIWTAHMNRVIGLVPDVDFKRPDDVISREIDRTSGMLATPYCPEVRNEIFVRGTEPTELCEIHSGGNEFFPFFRSRFPEERDSGEISERDTSRRDEDRDQDDDDERKKKRKENKSLWEALGEIFD